MPSVAMVVCCNQVSVHKRNMILMKWYYGTAKHDVILVKMLNCCLFNPCPAEPRYTLHLQTV